MTPAQFLESVIDAYRAARVPIQPHSKLSRGESRSIASETEDRFAHFLVNRVENVDHIFINQTLTLVSKGVRTRIKPDLSICRDDDICVLIDLKMDLGYKRIGFADSMREIDALMNKIRGRTFSLWKKVGEGRDRLDKNVSATAKYVFVVVSDQNINGGQFQRIEETAAQLENTDLLVLLRGMHPNTYGQSRQATIGKMRRHICNDSFQELEALVRGA